MPNVIISADSTCDLSPEQRKRHQVHSFPFHIEFRGRDHLDNIDITPQVLFDGFYEDKSLPQTGACSPEAYRQHFAELTADGSKVVHFNLGSALSSAYENASAAAAIPFLVLFYNLNGDFPFSFLPTDKTTDIIKE